MGKSIIGGILCIVSGVLGILSSVMFFFMSSILPSIIGEPLDQATQNSLDTFWVVYKAIGAGYLILGILAIIGGIFAIRKMQWGWVVAGAIISILVFWPTGIAALVILLQAKPEIVKP